MRETGLEPVRWKHTPLKRARLPIPPLPRTLVLYHIEFEMSIGFLKIFLFFYIEKILTKLMPLAEEGKVCVFLNIGDHKNILDTLIKDIPHFSKKANFHADNFVVTEAFCTKASYDENLSGIHVFYHKDIFAAVYSTNMLMREADVMITKPSELAFYPVPKMLIRRVGAHEAYGALRSAEIGDGTIECRTYKQALDMLDLLITERQNITSMCENILKADKIKIYDGSYEAIKLAVKLSKEEYKKCKKTYTTKEEA